MSSQDFHEPMLDMYIFETTQNIEQLEMLIIETEKSGSYNQNTINEILRIIHTIKGSSAMMFFDEISKLTHSIDNLFYLFPEQKPQYIDCAVLSDIVLQSIDFIKCELRCTLLGDGNISLTLDVGELITH